jgi:predicted phosphodiesterase
VRYLILSDIHADIEALERVLEHAKGAWDQLVFLGDAIGYGHEPEAVVQRLIELSPTVALQGNHEAMALDALETSASYGPARHPRSLSRESLDFLASLKPSYQGEHWGAVHGALRHPWEYLISIPVARANLPYMQVPLYFVGHTHVASAFIHQPGAPKPWQALSFRAPHSRLKLQKDAKLFVNPGSVGQPRDGLDQAGYAIFDEGEGAIEVFRV